MIANIGTKAIALAGISALVAGSIAVVNTVSQGVLFEVQKARAAEQAALAAKLDAENKLKGTENTAAALVGAAAEQARAMVRAADVQAQAIRDSTAIAVHPDNTTFDDVTSPMLTAPMKKVAELNEQIVRLRRELASGIDRKTRKPLTDSEVAEKTSRRLILEEELSMLEESTTKNWSDSVNLILRAVGQGVGGLDNSLSGVNNPVKRRRISEGE